jgi:glycosyltransferase involved in cell wall biosynthesis
VVLAIDGVIREVVDAAGCGIFVQPGNPSALAQAIQALAADRGRSRQMGLAGRNYLEEHFSRMAIAEKFAQIVESCQTQPRS